MSPDPFDFPYSDRGNPRIREACEEGKSKMIITVMVEPHVDETGHIEEFTWDLFPILDSSKTRHLQDNGLPRVGCVVTEGMILVGKIGKTKSYDSDVKLSASDVAFVGEEEIRRRYGHMWADGSYYARAAERGRVVASRFEGDGERLVAMVDIEKL
jgi:DNA-directed RNA polymerase beta subunit